MSDPVQVLYFYRTKWGAHDEFVELFRRNGCVRCRQTGYRGRVGVFQLLAMNEELSALAARKASHEELERAAMNGDMTTLWADGIDKVVAGLTSIEELARVTTI